MGSHTTCTAYVASLVHAMVHYTSVQDPQVWTPRQHRSFGTSTLDGFHCSGTHTASCGVDRIRCPLRVFVYRWYWGCSRRCSGVRHSLRPVPQRTCYGAIDHDWGDGGRGWCGAHEPRCRGCWMYRLVPGEGLPAAMWTGLHDNAPQCGPLLLRWVGLCPPTPRPAVFFSFHLLSPPPPRCWWCVRFGAS